MTIPASAKAAFRSATLHTTTALRSYAEEGEYTLDTEEFVTNALFDIQLGLSDSGGRGEASDQLHRALLEWYANPYSTRAVAFVGVSLAGAIAETYILTEQSDQEITSEPGVVYFF